MTNRPDRLLVVDDDEDNRAMLSRRLERKGFAVQMACHGRQALERIAAEPFDLVLLDHMMPGLSGMEVLEVLRRTHSAADLPVIMVTAESHSESIVRALGLGANDYITKPIDFPVALARIQTQLQHKHAEEALRESEQRYALAAQGADDGLWDWNVESGKVYFSPRWKTLVGLAEDAPISRPGEWFDLVHADDLERLQSQIAAHEQGRSAHLECEHRLHHADGSYRWMLTRGRAVRDAQGRTVRMAGSLTDITEGKVADPLTGLPNRLLFLERVGEALERARTSEQPLFAVLSLDLDRFQLINDSYGREIGDRLLIGFTRRLKAGLRSTDAIAKPEPEPTLARLGGDEFAILLEGIREPADALRVADRLLRDLATPLAVAGRDVYATASMGIALSAAGYERAEELLRDADTALNQAKATGRARYAVFEASMRDGAITRLQLETDLRRAVERGEFEVRYQPIVRLANGRTTGFEALVRWRHPERGLISPAAFIPVAEETGLIVPLGEWTLAEACRQMAAWQRQFAAEPPLSLSVNASGKQIARSQWIEEIERILAESGIEPRSLKIEITESVILDNPEAIRTILRRLSERSVRFSLDDFGTGYSSLSYLHQFPLDTLKIDRSFVSSMGAGGQKPQIVQAIIDLAHTLGMDVVAEGVETNEQMEQLRRLGCEYGQGYLFAPPLEAEAARRLLAAEQERRDWAALQTDHQYPASVAH